MIRKVYYDQDFVDYLSELQKKDKAYYKQHVEVITRVCRALATEAENRFGVEKIEGDGNHYRVRIEAELLDTVFQPEGYSLRFSITDYKVFVSSITFTDLSRIS